MKNFTIINNTMNKNQSDKTTIIKDASGKETVIVRVDKTIGELLGEEQLGKWSPDYWNPKFDYLDELLKKTGAKSLFELEGENVVIAGDHVRPSRGEKKGFNLGTGIEYYETAGFLEVAYDYSRIKECSENAFKRLKETAVKQYDILISVAGVGGVGKARSCIVTNKPADKSCTGDVFSIRLKKLNPFYFYVFLKSKIGKDQILKMKNGVGTENLNTKEALALRIPPISEKVQGNIEQEYKRMLDNFDKAMEATKKGDEAEYKKNIEAAEVKLHELITRTEAAIRGEREDVI